MKVTIICGSIAQKSHTNSGLRYIENLLKQKGIQTVYWDLKEQPLPIALPQYHSDPLKHPEQIVRQFVTTVNQSQGVVLGTPVYHGSYSGVLKNALDNLQGDAFRNKPVGLLSHASGERSGVTGCEHLRSVVRTLYGYALQTQVITASSDYTNHNREYVLISLDIKERCERFTDELVQLSRLFSGQDVTKED